MDNHNFKRAFWIVCDETKEFGMHGHKTNEQIIFAVHGALRINIINKQGVEQVFYLRKPSDGLLIEAGEWAKETPLLPNTVALVLCSHPFDPNDYIL